MGLLHLARAILATSHTKLTVMMSQAPSPAAARGQTYVYTRAERKRGGHRDRVGPSQPRLQSATEPLPGRAGNAPGLPPWALFKQA